MITSGRLTSQEHGASLRGHGLNIVGSTFLSGSLRFEKPVQLSNCVISSCRIGAYSYVSDSTRLHNTSIGRFCSIADNVISSPGDHPVDRLSTSASLYTDIFAWHSKLDTHAEWHPFSPVAIGHDVWICTGAKILGGVKVGNGSIVAAGAVVTKDVEPYTVVGGVPARTLRARFPDRIVERLVRLQAWNFDLPEIMRRSQTTFDERLDLSALDSVEKLIYEYSELKISSEYFSLKRVENGQWRLGAEDETGS